MPKPTPPATARKEGVRIKTYLVMLRRNLARDGEPNVCVIDVKLTRSAADAIANQIAGAWVDGPKIATK